MQTDANKVPGPKVPPVDRIVSELGKSIDLLGEDIAALERRLENALGAEPRVMEEQGLPSEREPTGNSNLTETLREIEATATRHRARIAHLLARIEL